MKRANVYVHGLPVGVLEEHSIAGPWKFVYHSEYNGPPVSLTLPVDRQTYDFQTFPAFFEGLLPEGMQLEALLRIRKIDRNDLFSQLTTIGADPVGAVTVEDVL